MKHIEPGKPLPPSLRTELLHAAQTELRAVRQQLVSWRLIWKAFVHRDERAILKHYWGLAERERFHDGARVAELLVAVRQRLNEKECTGARSSQGPSAAAWDGHASAGQGQPGGGRLDNVGYLRRVGDKYNLARATWITTAITGDRDTIKAVLKSHGHPRPDEDAQPRPDAQRTRWVLLQRSTPSWQAAYNTACLYAALAGKYSEKKMTQRVVTSLRRAINDPHCELGREWANEDPDFSSVRSEKQFKTFFADPSEMDHPQVKPVQAHH